MAALLKLRNFQFRFMSSQLAVAAKSSRDANRFEFRFQCDDSAASITRSSET
jgi:hypothetical protein